MKQIVTIFRAEGPQATRLLRLCRKTLRTKLPDLRVAWRKDVRRNLKLSAYVEYMDAWSMGDDFCRIMGPAVEQRAMPDGAVYFLEVNKSVYAYLRQQMRRKHQFPEQAERARLIAILAKGFGACDPPVALAVFREVVGGRATDEEIWEGSNHPLFRLVDSRQ